MSIVLLALAMPAEAARATPEQMQALAAKEGDQLLADPSANYRRVLGVLIRPGAVPDAELLTRFADALAKADTASRRARLHYLLANTYYWQGFRELRKTLNRAAVGDAVPRVMSQAMAAFEEAQKVAPPEQDPEIRADAEAFLRTLLRLNLYGADLAPELKQKVVVGFLDVLEKAPGGFPPWPPEERAAVYGNLGVSKRLAAELPATLPDDPKELRRVMKLASPAFPQQAFRCAQALEARLDLSNPTTDPAVAMDVFAAYRGVDPDRALHWLTKVAARWPIHYLTLFDYTAEPALKIAWPERMAHLQAFLTTGTGNGEGHIDPCLAYDQAVAALMREKRYAEALECADAFLARPPSFSARLADLWYAKGRCHIALGQKDKARQAFQKSIDHAPFAAVPEWSKTRATQALAQAADDAPSVQFSLEANVAKCSVGTPILLRLSLRNTGVTEYKILGQPGWGQELDIQSSQGKWSFIDHQSDVPYKDTDLGAECEAVYYFIGHIPPNDCQYLVYMISTKTFTPGTIRFRAVTIQGKNKVETPEIQVMLFGQATGPMPKGEGEIDRNQVLEHATHLHNLLGHGWRRDDIAPFMRRTVDSQATDLETEYILYGAVLQGAARNATAEDRTLAKDAAKALLARFPNSWLRAHTYAALAMIYGKDGHPDDARQAVQACAALPESRPLLQNLGLWPEPKAGNADRN